MANPLFIASRLLADAARERAPVHRVDVRLVLGLAAAGWIGDQLLGTRTAPPEAVLAVINVWVQIAIMVISALLSYALAPKPAEPPKPSLEDLSLPTAEEGRPLPVVFGTVWVTGPNVLWYGDLRTTPIKSGGGK